MVLLVIVLILIVIAAFFLGVMVYDHSRFVVRNYVVRSAKLDLERKNLRIVYVSDLHDQVYGENNAPIIETIKAQNPDVILVGGDLMIAKPSMKKAIAGDPSWMDKSLAFLAQLAPIAPVYLTNGNHETRMEKGEDGIVNDFYIDYQNKIGALGVHTLHNESKDLPGTNIRLYGYEHAEEHYEKLVHNPIEEKDPENKLGRPDQSKFVLMLAHNPKFFEYYAKWGADLVLSGHVHGGLMRIGKLGFIGPDLHLFPKYSGGTYVLWKYSGEEIDSAGDIVDGNANSKASGSGINTLKEKSTMILSCGLGAHTLPIRIFNPGEISVIDLESIHPSSSNSSLKRVK